MSEMSDAIRKSWGENDARRDAGLETPPDVVRFDNIAYGADPHWQILDVYRPRLSEVERLPVIVSVHGGGWIYGTKEVYQYYCMSLAQHGFAVVNFTYRLVPEFTFPAAIQDTNGVCRWVLDHAEEYGFDICNVFAVGDSAGAQILGLYCAVLADVQFAAHLKIMPPPGFCFNAVALNCGAYRRETGPQADPRINLLIKELFNDHGTEQELADIDVVNHVNGGFPPVFLMTSSGDFLKQQAPLLAQALIDNRVPFQFRMYGDKEHVLYHVFHCNIRLPQAAQCNQDECEFFKKSCITGQTVGGMHS